MIGTRLLHYEVTSQLGEGGMGVVYQATDTRLSRDVAIKVLPAAFVEDAERLARFQREAQLLASLNHPNIGGIYGLEEEGAQRFLVLELIPGETLAERLTRGAMPVAEVLPIALQLAQALEAAHARGIVHRDLKPANVKLTPEGTVKVLDFGLAKAWDQPADSGLTRSPTLTAQMTQAGVILGTASYMSPEQARGQEADKRADIWSFGVVLFEMLAGGRIFAGETVTDILGAIVHKEPEWERLPANLPASLERLLRRCLEKDRTRRLQDIGDARIEIEETIERGPEAPHRRRDAASPAASRWLPWLAAAAALALALWALLLRGPEPVPQPPLARYTVALAEAMRLEGLRQPVAVSRDGSKIAYTATDGVESRVYLRDRSGGETRPLAGTEGASYVVFSPDGESIAFYQGDSIRRLSLGGGTPLVVTAGSNSLGFDWSEAEEIVFAPDWGDGIYRVPADGSAPPQAVTRLDVSATEGTHLSPEVLPGGKTVLFSTWESLDTGRISVAIASLASGEHHTLLEDAMTPHYSPSTGRLLFVRAGTLMAVPFDPAKLEITGQPVTLQTGIRTYPPQLTAIYDVSDEGTLVFQGGGITERRRELDWVGPDGEPTPAVEDRAPFYAPEISPDGGRLALTVEGPLYSVWIYDLGSGSRSRLTRQSDNGSAAWTPDGREVVFWSARVTPNGIFRAEVDGSSEPILVYQGAGDIDEPTVSPDGRVAIFKQSGGGNADLIAIDLDGEANARPFKATKATEERPVFSPDGRWVAYQADESGRFEIYVAPFPGPGASWLVSSGGGVSPRWSTDGRRLFYCRDDQVFAVDISTGDRLQAKRPRLLFTLPNLDDRGLDVAPDGERLLVVRDPESASPYDHRLEVVLEWPRLLDE